MKDLIQKMKLNEMIEEDKENMVERESKSSMASLQVNPLERSSSIDIWKKKAEKNIQKRKFGYRCGFCIVDYFILLKDAIPLGNIQLPLHAETNKNDGSVTQVFSTQFSKCIGFVALAGFVMLSTAIFFTFGTIKSFGHEFIPYQKLESFDELRSWDINKPRYGYQIYNLQNEDAEKFCQQFNDKNKEGKLAYKEIILHMSFTCQEERIKRQLTFPSICRVSSGMVDKNRYAYLEDNDDARELHLYLAKYQYSTEPNYEERRQKIFEKYGGSPKLDSSCQFRNFFY